MTPAIKRRIAQIRPGQVPKGYKKGTIGIVPEEWSPVSFSTLFTSTSRYTDDLSRYPLYSLTIEDGITKKTERYERSHLVKKENSYKVVQPNDYAYNPMNIRFGAVARYKGKKPVAVSGYYDVFTAIHKSDCAFMDFFLTCGPMITYYNKVSKGSLIEKQRVHFSDFMEFSIELPPIEERKEIAKILATQDRVIELLNQKIEQLKQLKKYYLRKMFPQHAKTVPEVRFPGFTGAWEKHQLGEIVAFSKGNGYSKADLKATGTPIILYGRLYTKYEMEVSDVDTFAMAKPGSVYSHGDEVIVPASGETAEDIAVASVVKQSGILLGGDINILTPSSDVDSLFMAISLSGGSAHGDVIKMAQGKSVVHLHQTDLRKVVLAYPTLSEQMRINGCFRNLERLIALNQRKQDEEVQKKKALMQLLLTGIVRVNV